MSNTLHHIDSVRYGSLTPESIDFVLECVRDANEVLFATEILSAREMISIAWSVFECEQLFARDPAALTASNISPRSDWTLACVAEGLALAADKFSQSGRPDAAQRVRTELRALLQRLAKSSLRSPAVAYGRVLSALVYDLPSETPQERLSFLRLAIVEDLGSHSQSNVIELLCELGDCYMLLGIADLALHIYLSLVRFDPLSIAILQNVVVGLQRSAPEVALAAAERALLLLPRDDPHNARPFLRRSIEELRGRSSASVSAFGKALLVELQGKPGKKARTALRTLCLEVDPQIADVPDKDLEPLPDVAELARLRSALKALPLPYPTHVERELERTAPTPAPSSATATTKVGRNDRCPCGSSRKWKRCCGAPG